MATSNDINEKTTKTTAAKITLYGNAKEDEAPADPGGTSTGNGTGASPKSPPTAQNKSKKSTQPLNAPTDALYFFEDEIFRIDKKGNVKFGVVIETCESYSGDEDESFEDVLGAGEVRVAWYPEGKEVVQPEKSIGLADRTLMPGDVVRRLLVNKSNQRGYCRDISMYADVRILGTKYVIRNVAAERLRVITGWQRDSAVCLDSWVGSTKDVEEKAVLKSLTSGTRIELTSSDFGAFKETHSSSAPGIFGANSFFQGNIVFGPLATLENVTLLTPDIPLQKSKKGKFIAEKFIIESIETDQVWVHWQCKALSQEPNAPASAALLQPNPCVKGEDLKRLKRLNLFESCMLQICDRSYLKFSKCDTIIKKSDWNKEQEFDSLYETSALPNYGHCLTPDGEHSFCNELKDCKSLYNLLTSSIRDVDRMYLRRSQCGYRNGTVLICCPKYYNISSNAPPLTTITTTIKPVLTDLLPKPGQCGNILSNRIYGVQRTRIDEFPWMALIEYTKPTGNKGHYCGGSLINTRYVITSSHCDKNLPKDLKLTGVRLGEWEKKTNPDCEVDKRGEKNCAPEHLDIPVERVIPHPNYDPASKNQVNDLALLRLNRNIAYTDFIRPICLPVNNELRIATFDGINMDVSGWGKTEQVASTSIKLKAQVVVLPLEKCQNTYIAQNIHLENSQLCAGGEKGIDSCFGTSLIGIYTPTIGINYHFLAGVVSFGPIPCGVKGFPDVYTRVGHFMDWIQQTLEP